MTCSWHLLIGLASSFGLMLLAGLALALSLKSNAMESELVFYKHVDAAISDENSYRQLLAARGEHAQKVIDRLQQLLLHPPHHPPLCWSSQRPKLLKALLRLSKTANLLPSMFYLSNVRCIQRIVDYATPSTDIYRGIHRGHVVFLKRYRLFSGSWSPECRAELLNREAVIWANHQHPNVLPFLGVFECSEPYDPGLYLVSPFLEDGTMIDYIKAHPTANRLLLMKDVFNAMSYLHSNDIIHGDLKGANVLVASGRACIADLGFSRLTTTAAIMWATIQSAPSLGTVPWQAPELLWDCSLVRLLVPTSASDVYSLGCLAYEVFANRHPFWDLHPNSPFVWLEIFKEVIEKDRRPTKPEPYTEAYTLYGLTEDIWEMMVLCWNRDPELRPSALELSMLPFFIDIIDDRPS